MKHNLYYWQNLKGYRPCPPSGKEQVYFSLFTAPISTTRPFQNVSLIDIYNYLISPCAKQATQQLRQIPNEKERRHFKAEHFDYCTFSGIFSYRSDKAIIEHSGLICLDFDHLPDVEATFSLLKDDRYFETLLLFRSPSGDGLKWVISFFDSFRRYRNGEESLSEYQTRFFPSLYNYIFNHYDVQVDKSCRNVSRACFLPYDPSAFLNPSLL